MIQCKPVKGDETWELLKKQVLRMAGMLGFPREPAALKELGLALREAETVEHAESIIGEILETAVSDTRCPMPAQIRAKARAGRMESRPDPYCHKCGGDGWVFVIRGMYSGADRCTCWAPRPEPEYERAPARPPAVTGSLKQVPQEESWHGRKNEPVGQKEHAQ